MYHRRVRSTQMPMRIGLQEQVAYLRDGLGSIPRTILRRISNPVGSGFLLWNRILRNIAVCDSVRIVTIQAPVSYTEQGLFWSENI